MPRGKPVPDGHPELSVVRRGLAGPPPFLLRFSSALSAPKSLQAMTTLPPQGAHPPVLLPNPAWTGVAQGLESPQCKAGSAQRGTEPNLLSLVSLAAR